MAITIIATIDLSYKDLSRYTNHNNCRAILLDITGFLN